MSIPRADQQEIMDLLMPALQASSLEAKWAEIAIHQAETYYHLLQAIPDKSRLKLTPIDDEIHSGFRALFPDLNVDVLDVELIKSQEAITKWRPFLMGFKDRVEDFNFGTLQRIESKGDYTEENTCIVPRIQFYCFEIARNREGLNKVNLV